VSTTELAIALHQLELAAAAAGHLLQDLPKDTADEVLDAWRKTKSKRAWLDLHRQWLLEAAAVWPDPEPDERDAAHLALIAWCRRT
jgi:hypothetical protein